jgi:antitoxin ParD1/3/4
MNVSLTPELEKLVKDEIESGDYKSATEVVLEGLRLLRGRREKLDALRREIQLGIDAIEQGRFREYTSVEDLFEDIEAAVTKRREQSALR